MRNGQEFLEKMLKKAGSYKGTGISAQGDEFEALIELIPNSVFNWIEFEFKGKRDENVFYQEKGFFSVGEDQRFYLGINTSVQKKFIFCYLEDFQAELEKEGVLKLRSAVFSEKKIQTLMWLDFWSNGDLGYRFGWKTDSKPFEIRAGARLKRTSSVFKSERERTKDSL